MKRNPKAFILSLLALLAVAPAAFSQGGSVYEVTITNLTPTQILSPPIVTSHSFRTRIFTPGRPASAELAAVAEDADASGLLASLGSNPEVFDFAQADDVLLPGQSVTLEVQVQGRFRRLSALGMLVTTNDAFFGLSNFRLDPRSSNFDLTVPAYDAGSEANTESCDQIPGPPCGNGGVRFEDGAEGFVHVHRGIHGVGDLSSFGHDWRNPVARIRIARK